MKYILHLFDTILEIYCSSWWCHLLFYNAIHFQLFAYSALLHKNFWQKDYLINGNLLYLSFLCLYSRTLYCEIRGQLCYLLINLVLCYRGFAAIREFSQLLFSINTNSKKLILAYTCTWLCIFSKIFFSFIMRQTKFIEFIFNASKLKFFFQKFI